MGHRGWKHGRCRRCGCCCCCCSGRGLGVCCCGCGGGSRGSVGSCSSNSILLPLSCGLGPAAATVATQIAIAARQGLEERGEGHSYSRANVALDFGHVRPERGQLAVKDGWV